ncbi:hypothetical protein [Actinomadura sp. 7K507]|uniref:hypothetical protein n=1 Tax=Actinomadura sp. 7K507 TaxID=2530365 RepID=UPI00104749F8|nr:hypothetical protein [Actinomadura sp. 7K507]TDC75122.1 hypothetical protein E1285_41955 [Actinomadura sp. 7K507]
MNRPPPVIAALVLLGGTWAVFSLMLVSVIPSTLDAARETDRTRAALGEEASDGSAYESASTEAGLFFFALLFVLALLIWAASRALRGGQEGRIGLWVTAALLSLPTLGLTLWAIATGGADVATVFIFMVATGAAAVAALLLALPTANAYFRRPERV